MPEFTVTFRRKKTEVARVTYLGPSLEKATENAITLVIAGELGGSDVVWEPDTTSNMFDVSIHNEKGEPLYRFEISDYGHSTNFVPAFDGDNEETREVQASRPWMLFGGNAGEQIGGYHDGMGTFSSPEDVMDHVAKRHPVWWHVLHLPTGAMFADWEFRELLKKGQ